MIAFQFNLTVGHFTEEYLKKWLAIIAANGYDTVLWEIEDAVRWDTCPEVAAEEAFTKAEFKSILDFSSELGLNNIPLLQTLAHNAYVLNLEKYHHLADHPGFIELYCPLNPDVHDFLNTWILEHVELFGDPTHFHLGCDEAWALGGQYCDGKCPEYMKDHSISELFTQHLLKLTEPLIAQGITPIIWADMLLKHNEILDMIPKEITLFDWMYETQYDGNIIYEWETNKLCSLSEIPEKVKSEYKEFLFQRNGKDQLNPFYTSLFLKSKGFKVVGCSATASYGDNVFSLRDKLHSQNCFGWFNEYNSGNTNGYALTSWTVHLFPYEMQQRQVLLPDFLARYPKGNMNQFQMFFTTKIFGMEIDDFFEACELLSGNVLFSYTSSLGFNTCILETPDKHIEKTLEKLEKANDLVKELENCHVQLEKYLKALTLFKQMETEITKGRDLLDLWILQSKNMINRAKSSMLILDFKIAEAKNTQIHLPQENVDKTLSELQHLKLATSTMYTRKIKPVRRKQIVSLMFDCVESELIRISRQQQD